jgi:integrase
VEISGTPTLNTKLEAERAEGDHVQRVVAEYRNPTVQKMKVPTFAEWFEGRYLAEWCPVNKPGTIAEKRSAYEYRIKPAFGDTPLNEIGTAELAQFRAKLLADRLSKKTVNNLLTIVSKPLRYAFDVGVIDKVPKVGILKHERPEIQPWELDEYAAILREAKAYGREWYAAVCLAGEAGLRVGEVRALRWDDVDMKAGTITVARQRRQGEEGTTKGGTRRTLPMTGTLLGALRSLDSIRKGYVICNLDDGTPKTDGQTGAALRTIYEGAGLPERDGAWHLLRHSFGTHAALFAVNPWTLMRWMGHKRIDETMIYVHFAESHKRSTPADVQAVGDVERDPDRRVIAMLGCRCTHVAPGSDSVAIC